MVKKVCYYHDALHDDFAGTNIDTIRLPDDYVFVDRNPFFVAGETLLRLIVCPILYLILLITLVLRMRNLKVLKAARGCGYFIYGNHTNTLLDAYVPSLIAFPKKVHIIANPDAVSIKGLKTVVRMLGAYPIPSSLNGMRNFVAGVREYIGMGRVFAIYPEAHIWPYYTDIRHFGKESFHYPADCDAPSFAFTNIYVKRKCTLIRKPKVVTYVDGPFYPDASLPRAQRIEKLRDEIYRAMKTRADAQEKYEYIHYQYTDDPDEVGMKEYR